MTVRSSTSSGGDINVANLDIDVGGALDIYNTADKTTNYERLRADWSANNARIYTTAGGTGTPRALILGAISSVGNPVVELLTLRRTSMPFVTLSHDATATIGNAFQIGGPFSAAANTQVALAVAPTLNQSSTAGATILNIDPTVTATGSGTYLIQRCWIG